MHEKSIDEEIPDTTEGLIIYRKGILKELGKIEPAYKKLKLVLKRIDEKLIKSGRII